MAEDVTAPQSLVRQRPVLSLILLACMVIAVVIAVVLSQGWILGVAGGALGVTGLVLKRRAG